MNVEQNLSFEPSQTPSAVHNLEQKQTETARMEAVAGSLITELENKIIRKLFTLKNTQGLQKYCILTDVACFNHKALEGVTTASDIFRICMEQKKVQTHEFDFNFLLDMLKYGGHTKLVQDIEGCIEAKQKWENIDVVETDMSYNPTVFAAETDPKRPIATSSANATTSKSEGEPWQKKSRNSVTTSDAQNVTNTSNLSITWRNEEIAIGPHLNPYSFEKHSTQLVVIINNYTEHRQGTMTDEERLTKFIKQLDVDHETQTHFMVYADLNRRKMGEELDKARDTLQSRDAGYKRALIFIFSHGNKEGICGFVANRKNFNSERDIMPVDDITATFADSIPGFPKAIFLVACHGSELNRTNSTVESDAISDVHDMELESPSIHLNPRHSDMLISYASVKGFKGLRDSVFGTFYMDVMVRIFKKLYKEYHLVDMLTIGQSIVSRKMAEVEESDGQWTYGVQMPMFHSTLRRPVYLVPR